MGHFTLMGVICNRAGDHREFFIYIMRRKPALV